MESSRSLPDSPPGTSSSKSSPTFPTATTPALTPPKSPEVHRATHSASPPTAGSSPLPPLPNEVFLSILRHLPQPNRRRVRLVSRSWNSFLLAEPSLWGYLHVELLGGDRMEDWVDFWTSKASVNLNGKTNGGVRRLQVALGAGDGRSRYADRMHFQEVAQRLFNVMQSVESASVPHTAEDHLGRRLKTKSSTLISLKVTSRPNTMSSIHVLHGISMFCRRRLCESLVE